MRRPLALVALVAVSCSAEPVPGEELAVRVESAAYEVRLAEGFPLTVTRTWSKELVPEEWSDETLSPLVVRSEDVARREDGSHVQEVRRFTAFAAELGDVRVLPPLLVATRGEGGEEVVVSGEALDLRVLPVLPPGDASDVELPGGMLRPPAPWGAWLTVFGALLAGALLTRRLSARPAPPPEETAPSAPPDPPDVRALRALADATVLGEADDPRPLHDAVSDALRAYVRERFGLGTPETTAEELAAAADAAAMPESGLLRDVLLRCTMVRFARADADADARGRLVEDARELVRTTAGAAS